MCISYIIFVIDKEHLLLCKILNKKLYSGLCWEPCYQMCQLSSEDAIRKQQINIFNQIELFVYFIYNFLTCKIANKHSSD